MALLTGSELDHARRVVETAAPRLEERGTTLEELAARLPQREEVEAEKDEKFQDYLLGKYDRFRRIYGELVSRRERYA